MKERFQALRLSLAAAALIAFALALPPVRREVPQSFAKLCGFVSTQAQAADLKVNLPAQAAELKNNSALPAPPNSAEIQTQRSLGKAYYEQGKYKEAVDAFSKVVAAGHAVALDHLDLAQGLIQTNQLDRALEELNTAEQMAPKNLAIRYNLGILYKHELRYTDSERELKQVAAADPNDPPTWFNLGDVYFAEHQLQPALDAFERVVNMGYARAQNFYVAATFHCFIILNRLKQPAEAQKYLKLNMATRNKVPSVSLQYPALEAGKYGEVNIAPPGEIAPLNSLPREVAFQNIAPTVQWAAVRSTRSRPNFPFVNNAQLDAQDHLLRVFGSFPFLAVGDYAGNGLPGIYLSNGWETINHLLLNKGNGTFTDVTGQAGVEGPNEDVAAEFVDYNNSGHPSLVVVGLGGLTLYKNNGNGTFSDVTKTAGLKGDPCELDTDVKAVDLENDGLLDLIVSGYADACHYSGSGDFAFGRGFPAVASHIYRNNGDGTFTDVTVSSGIGSVKGHFRHALFADFNNDGYMDLLFLRDGAPPVLFLNQGADKFLNATADAGPALAQAHADGGVASDFNHDGRFDLALWGPDGYRVLINRGGAHFSAMRGLPAIRMGRGWPPSQLGAMADLDGNGFDDLLLKDQTGTWHALLNEGGRFKEAELRLPRPAWTGGVAGQPPRWEGPVVPAWFLHPGELDLASVFGPKLIVFQRQGPAPRWIQVNLEGYKSNKQGIGDVIELKAGNFYKKVLATHGGSVRIFVGNLPKLDVVRVTWPNQVVQNSVNVPTDTTLDVRESERLASSCPFLYVWNGKRFVFYTDILGDAPIGELAPDGTYLTPNPQDLIRLGSNLTPRHGDYVFQITDEMREVDYVDQARLLAVDHPADEDVYSNEIYSPTPAAPQLYLVRNKRFPVSAVDDRGRNVLPLIRYADGRYPTDFRRKRMLGLADLHSLTLDLGAFPSNRHVALWLRGWVFWTDSNASRALMSNRHEKMTDPYIQVRDKAGHWITVIPDAGLPSGTNRTMRIDLTGKFPTADHHVRIVTNLCVYWDQIFFTTEMSAASPPGCAGLTASRNCHSKGSEEPAFRAPRTSRCFAQFTLSGNAEIPRFAQDDSEGLSMTGSPFSAACHALSLVSADLHYRGFSAVASDPNHLRPDYFDYAKLMTQAPWNPAGGPYTRYGSVERLLMSADDQLVAMSTGDEMTVKFSAAGLPKLKPGWKRDFFLEVRGYAKDGEPNTAFARSVNPLPFRAMPGYPPPGSRKPSGAAYQQYLREYQTRRAYDLIPPLAPESRSP